MILQYWLPVGREDEEQWGERGEQGENPGRAADSGNSGQMQREPRLISQTEKQNSKVQNVTETKGLTIPP